MAIIFGTVKLTIYLLNILVNHTFELTSSSSAEEENPQNDDGRPKDMPSTLWCHITDFLDRPIDENDVMNLITEGHDPELVFRFYHIVINNEYPASIRQNASRRNEIEFRKRRETYLNCCGHLAPINLTRMVVEEVFPMNNSLLYVIFGYIFLFLAYFLTGICFNHYEKWQQFFAPIVLGGSIYSFLAPPEEENYSLTKSEIQNGLTRLFTIWFLSAIWAVLIYLSDNGEIFSISFLDFTLNLNFAKILEFIEPLFQYIICFIFVFIHLIIPNVLTFLHYFIEAVNNYAFGCGCSARLSHSLMQFFRGAISVFIVYIWNFQNSNAKSSSSNNMINPNNNTLLHFFEKNETLSDRFFRNSNSTNSEISIFETCLIFPFIMLILQFPLSWTIQLRKHLLSFIIFVLVNCMFAYVLSLLEVYLQSYVFALFSTLFSFLMEIVFPYYFSNNKYFLFHFRIFGFQSKTLNFLRMTTQMVTMPVLLSLIMTTEQTKAPKLFLSFVFVALMTKSLTEPHIFVLSAILFFLFFTTDFLVNDLALRMFLSLFIARKMVNIYQIFDFAHLFRFFPFSIEEIETAPILSLLISKLYFELPCVDRILQVPSVLWSCITGSPFFSPSLVTFLVLPSPPRPSCFWAENNELDTSITFSAHLTEHPIETPVYTSCARALTDSFNGLIKSRRIGIVDSGDIFLFINDSMAAFIEVISMDVHCVYFKLRGLEYHYETSCHVGELGTLRRNVDNYDLFPNFIFGISEHFTIWDLRAIDVRLNQYSVHKYSLQTCFVSLDSDVMEQWITYCFAYILVNSEYSNPDGVRNTSINSQESPLQSNSDTPLISIQNDGVDDHSQNRTIQNSSNALQNACRLFNSSIDELSFDKINRAFNMTKTAILGRSLKIGTLNILFSGEIPPEWQDDEISSDNTLLEKVIFPSVRLSLTSLMLASMSLTPDITTELSEIPSYFEETNETCAAYPIDSPEFDMEFKLKKKSLLTIPDKNATDLLFFRIQMTSWNIFKVNREAVRTAWQSEAISQIYYSETYNERSSIQRYDELLHNLTVQSCDHPLGYPALVSPVIASFELPPGMQTF